MQVHDRVAPIQFRQQRGEGGISEISTAVVGFEGDAVGGQFVEGVGSLGDRRVDVG
jgi:hypothetical protein